MGNKFFLLLFFITALISCRDNLDFNTTDDNAEIDLRAVVNGVERYNYLSYTNENATFTVHVKKGNDYEEHYVYPVPKGKIRADGCDGGVVTFPEIISFGLQKNVTTTLKIGLKNKTINSSNCVIRPKSRSSSSSTPNSGDHSAVFRNGILELTITGPQMICLEIGGDLKRPLLVFANEIETYIPQKGVNWFGEVYKFEAGTRKKVTEVINGALKSNDMVYIEPGAIVEGVFYTEDSASNVQIRGRGIISGEYEDSRSIITMNGVNGAYIEGVTLVSSPSWVISLYQCYGDSKIDRVRVVSMTGWDDGIDLVGCKNTDVLNSFVMSKDDGIVIKAGCRYIFNGSKIWGLSDVDDIVVHNCMIWNGRGGSALEIGRNLNTGNVKNITYDYIHILHALNCNGSTETGGEQAAISIYNTGEAVVDNVLYKDIYIEDVESQIVNFFVIEDEKYSPSGSVNERGLPGNYPSVYKLGKISNITFQNVFVDKVNPLSSSIQSIGRLNGTTSENRITNINFRNFNINKKRIKGYSTDKSAGNADGKIHIMPGRLFDHRNQLHFSDY